MDGDPRFGTKDHYEGKPGESGKEGACLCNVRSGIVVAAAPFFSCSPPRQKFPK